MWTKVSHSLPQLLLIAFYFSRIAKKSEKGETITDGNDNSVINICHEYEINYLKLLTV